MSCFTISWHDHMDIDILELLEFAKLVLATSTRVKNAMFWRSVILHSYLQSCGRTVGGVSRNVALLAN